MRTHSWSRNERCHQKTFQCANAVAMMTSSGTRCGEVERERQGCCGEVARRRARDPWGAETVVEAPRRSFLVWETGLLVARRVHDPAAPHGLGRARSVTPTVCGWRGTRTVGDRKGPAKGSNPRLHLTSRGRQVRESVCGAYPAGRTNNTQTTKTTKTSIPYSNTPNCTLSTTYGPTSTSPHRTQQNAINTHTEAPMRKGKQRSHHKNYQNTEHPCAIYDNALTAHSPPLGEPAAESEAHPPTPTLTAGGAYLGRTMDHDPRTGDRMEILDTEHAEHRLATKRSRTNEPLPMPNERNVARPKWKAAKAGTDVATLERIWSTPPTSTDEDDYHDTAAVIPHTPTSAKGLIAMLHQRLPGLQHFNLTSNISKGKRPNEFLLHGLKKGQYRAIQGAAQAIGAECRPGQSHHRQIIIYNCSVHDIDDILSIGYPGQPVPYNIAQTNSGNHAIASFATKEEADTVAKAKKIRAGKMQWRIKQCRSNTSIVCRTCKSIECRDPACEKLRCGYGCSAPHATKKCPLTETEKQSKLTFCVTCSANTHFYTRCPHRSKTINEF
ncbi:unnamed protein product (mitochondrion) [Plasmodiophora brassicae]|uniref:Uncharacterized protein n=1 Tax=Plasmodiophora brassicae TaxID=37360 RepID=A0A3P3YL39_PLABS|nr:unnamed protein product [Plasmodiophora brassicae]